MLWTAVLLAGSLWANDIVFLKGRVVLDGGGAPGKTVDIELDCRGSEPVRQTNAGKNGNYYLKVERDEFNHIARALPATATDVGDSGGVSGSCGLRGKLKGYKSNEIDLTNFVIGKDLKLPDLVLKAEKK